MSRKSSLPQDAKSVSVALTPDNGRAFMDADEARAEALGAAFETWLVTQPFNADQLRLLHLVKEQIKANAADLTVFESWRFDTPPLSMNGGFERARAVFGSEEELERVLRDMNEAVLGDGNGTAQPGENWACRLNLNKSRKLQSDLLEAQFKVWLLKEPRFRDSRVYKKSLEELQTQYPQLWEQFFRTGATDETRSFIRWVDGIHRQHARWTSTRLRQTNALQSQQLRPREA